MADNMPQSNPQDPEPGFDQNATPVKAWFDTESSDGKIVQVPVMLADLPTIENHNTQDSLVNLVIQYSDGTTGRPYRFTDTQPHLRFDDELDDQGNPYLVF